MPGHIPAGCFQDKVTKRDIYKYQCYEPVNIVRGYVIYGISYSRPLSKTWAAVSCERDGRFLSLIVS